MFIFLQMAFWGRNTFWTYEWSDYEHYYSPLDKMQPLPPVLCQDSLLEKDILFQMFLFFH